MESQINTKREQQQTAPRGYYTHPIGRDGLILYVGNRERDQAEHQRDKSRWYHRVGGWMRRGWRAFKGGLRRWATVAIMFATLVNVVVACYQWRTAQGQLKEMEGSSADTKAAAAAAKTQATNTEKLAIAADQQSRAAQAVAGAAMAQAANTEKLALAAQKQMVVSRELAEATKSAAATADQTLALTHRPWVMVTHQMVTHQMVEPSRTEVALHFAKDDMGDVQASLILDERLENIGHSVAVDVVSWSEVIPAENTRRDPSGYQSALVRRKRHCDELRHPKATTPPGSVLFPQHKYLPVGKLLVTKDGAVRRAISLADHLWEGRIGSPAEGSVELIIVGCISYRASFEAPTIPRHQTRFMYVLGHPNIGRVVAALKPADPVTEVGLVPIPEETTAD